MATPLRLAVLGDPVAHSRSPAIHAVALRLAGLEGGYEAIRADEAVLGEAVEGLERGQFSGLNVTMPLKEAARGLAERATSDAGRAGSVNTLRYADGRVEGHSSDVTAFREIFGGGRFGAEDEVLILGAGGSARAALAGAGERRVHVSSRSESKAARLAAAHGAATVGWGAAVAGAVVVNATPLGMSGEELAEGVLGASSGLIDLPYGDEPTWAVSAAAGRGLPTVDGFEFLARQAAESFRWWTGISVSLRPLIEAARDGGGNR